MGVLNEHTVNMHLEPWNQYFIKLPVISGVYLQFAHVQTDFTLRNSSIVQSYNQYRGVLINQSLTSFLNYCI